MSEFPDFEKCTILKDENVIYSTLHEDLRPCKTCGKKSAKLVFDTEDSDGILHYQWYVVCDCGRNSGGWDTQEEAIEAWNWMADDGRKNED